MEPIGFKSLEEKIKKEKIHKPYDKIFKTIFKKNPNGFFIMLKIPGEFKGFMDSEIINYFYQELHVDIIIKNFENMICIIEFQSTKLSLDDITRFGNYMASLVHKEKKHVQLYVVTIANEKVKKISKNFGDYGFTIHIISLTEFDYNKALNRINTKIKNNEVFNEEDIVLLELLPLMTRKKGKKKKLLKKAAKLTNSLDGRIASSKLLEIKTIQFVLACELLNDNEKEKITKVITMKTENKEETFQGYLTEEEKQEIYTKAKEEIAKAKKETAKAKEEEIAKNLIKYEIPLEIIATATNMSLNEIEEISEKTL